MSLRNSLRNMNWSKVPAMLALCLVLFLAGQSVAYSQKPKKGKPVFSQSVAFNRDSIVVSDSIKAIRDSLHRVDSLFKVDSAAMQKHSSLEFPAFSTAKDSVGKEIKETSDKTGFAISHIDRATPQKYRIFDLQGSYIGMFFATPHQATQQVKNLVKENGIYLIKGVSGKATKIRISK